MVSSIKPPMNPSTSHAESQSGWIKEIPIQAQHPPTTGSAAFPVAVGPYQRDLLPGWSKAWMERRAADYHSGENYFRNLALARMGVLPFFVIACALVWSWSKRLFGKATALASTLLFTTLPSSWHTPAAARPRFVRLVRCIQDRSVLSGLWLAQPAWRHAFRIEHGPGAAVKILRAGLSAALPAGDPLIFMLDASSRLSSTPSGKGHAEIVSWR